MRGLKTKEQGGDSECGSEITTAGIKEHSVASMWGETAACDSRHRKCVNFLGGSIHNCRHTDGPEFGDGSEGIAALRAALPTRTRSMVW